MAYVKIILRHVLRKKLLTLINIAGLSVGLACVLMLALYVQDEWSIDRKHPAVENKYRVETILSAGTETLEIYGSLPPVAPLLDTNFPEIVDTTRFVERRLYVSGDDGRGFYENGLVFADANIGTFFRFDWLQGDPVTALQAPDSIIVTPDFAAKYFGADDPMGRTLLLDGKVAVKVTGVIAKPSRNSHISADAIAAISGLPAFAGDNYFENWFALGTLTYVELANGTDMNLLWPEIDALLNETMPPQSRRIFAPTWRAVSDIHLASRPDVASQRTRFDDVFVLFSISLAILLVACINFVNLATARSSERQKEIAIRKVAGSARWQIFLQHMAESTTMVLVALLIAMGIAELSLPVVNAYTGKELSLSGNGFWPLALIPGLVVALLAGFYPAVYLSRFRPLAVLRQKQRENAGFLSFRNQLVIFQFAIAIVAIVAGLVMRQQLQFAKSRDFGFDMSGVLVLEHEPDAQWNTFRQAILNRTAIELVSAALTRPFAGVASSSFVRYEGAEAPLNLSQFQVEFDYFELFDVDLLAGRLFSPEFATDRMTSPTETNPHPQMAVVLNKAMVDQLGWTPGSALGKTLEMNATPAGDFSQSIVGTVIGVVADMYVDSVQRRVVPNFFYVPLSAAETNFQFLKLPPGDEAAHIAQVETIWRELYPDVPLNAYMLETKFAEVYAREERQLALLSAFAFLAVFISCIGLIGLATYATEQRIKEVGIRKTVGASVWQIVVLFSSDFSKLVLIANVIAWPVAYVAMSRWLENFAYRIDLTPVIFIGSGLIALCIAWVTVGGTAAKAANAKPVLALRYE